MNYSAHSPLSDLEFPLSSAGMTTDLLDLFGADLVFVIECMSDRHERLERPKRSERVLGFAWKQAAEYEAETLVVEDLDHDFVPGDPKSFRQFIQLVQQEGNSQRQTLTFTYLHYVLHFDLTMFALPMVQEQTPRLLVVGHQISLNDDLRSLRESGATSSDRPVHQGLVVIGGNNPLIARVSYPRFLTHIARRIRQTLDLETIWTQTAEGLGNAFNVECCLVFGLSPEHYTLKFAAGQGSVQHWRLENGTLVLAEYPELQQAINHLTPTIASQIGVDGVRRSRLAIATTHQGHVNGLIVLDRPLVPTDDPNDGERAENRPENQTENQTENNAAATPNDPVWENASAPSSVAHYIRRNTVAHNVRRSIETSLTPTTPIWFPIEIEIIEEIANQVGTAVAHATLYEELELARQAAEEVSRIKSEFLANTSHELRTPLNGMMGFLKLIMDGMADDIEEQLEFVREAYRSAVHLLNIINDILDVAKIEAGKMQLHLEPVKLTELLEQLRNFTQAQIQSKQLYFRIQSPQTDDDIVLYGNYQRLLQVLLNLVGNAIKFTHEGGITVSSEVMIREVMVGDQVLPGLVKIQVADTGIGVSLDQQDKLFQSFCQVDGSRTRQYGGTGLGLTISQKLIETMGGEVNFYSMGEGLGSTVTFTVPLYQEPVMVSAAESFDELLDDRENQENTDFPILLDD